MKNSPIFDHMLRDYEERGLDDEGNPKPKKNYFVEMVENDCESLIIRARRMTDKKQKQKVLDALDIVLDLAREKKQ